MSRLTHVLMCLVLSMGFVATTGVAEELSIVNDCSMKATRSGRYIDYRISCLMKAEDDGGQDYYMAHRESIGGPLRPLRITVETSSFQHIASTVYEFANLASGIYSADPTAIPVKSFVVATNASCRSLHSTKAQGRFGYRFSRGHVVLMPERAWTYTITQPSPGMAKLICQDSFGMLQMINGRRLYRSDLLDPTEGEIEIVIPSSKYRSQASFGLAVQLDRMFIW